MRSLSLGQAGPDAVGGSMVSHSSKCRCGSGGSAETRANGAPFWTNSPGATAMSVMWRYFDTNPSPRGWWSIVTLPRVAAGLVSTSAMRPA